MDSIAALNGAPASGGHTVSRQVEVQFLVSEVSAWSCAIFLSVLYLFSDHEAIYYIFDESDAKASGVALSGEISQF